MRTANRPASSTTQPSSWLVVVLGLAAYVGLTYGLAVLPVQLEVPLPRWGAEVVPALVYGLLVLLCVRRLSILRWLIGTAVLSGVHFLLTLATGPLTVLLEPRLAGRPLPWMLPPPLPELVGAILLLVPLRDLLRASSRPGREKSPATAGRGPSGYRGRGLVAPRLQQAAPAEGTGLSEALLTQRGEPMPTPAPTPVLVGAGVATAPHEGAVSTIPETSRTRPDPAPSRPRRDERVQLTVARRDVLRIALDHIMDQLPPGTFLAPEDEVAASLADPGYLLIPAQLVVGQLAEGMARVTWSDIADQFPRRLVGLSDAEISAHLKDGIRLHLDEVVSQLPHELFVADSPGPDILGLNEIPAPFQPVEAAAPPAVSVSRSRAPAPSMAPPAPAKPSIEELALSVLETTARPPRPEPAPGATATIEATVRIPFDRVASELPADAFRVPLEQIASLLREPGCLLVSRSLVLPQLAEGQIRVSWEEVAPQFPRDQMTLSEAEMGQRVKGGIPLPLDEVIRQLPPDMFMTAGAAPDVRGLESFPAPFQPLVSDPAPAVSDPAPAPPRAEPAVETEPAPRAEAEAAPAVAPAPEARPLVSIEAAVEPEAPRPAEWQESPAEPVQRATDVALEPVSAGSLNGRSAPAPPEEEIPVDRPEAAEPEPEPEPRVVEQPVPRASVAPAFQWQENPASVPLSVAGGPDPAELAEARKIAALLVPVASFDVTVQSVEGVTVFAVVSPGVPQEVAASVAGLLLPLIGEERAPWPIDQLTFRGSDTALVLTPLGRTGARGPLLVACVPRGGSLALIEILSRRAAADAGRQSAAPIGAGAGSSDLRRLLDGNIRSRARELEPSLSAFGPVSARALRDAAGESTLCLFLPSGSDERAMGAFAQDIHSVMRKAAGAGTAFRTAVVRSGRQLMVIQPEDVAPGRSSIVVAAGEVTRPGLAYRQVERAAAALATA